MAIIALDYDGTYTIMPAVWDRWIADANTNGHTIVCVTMRRPDEAVKMPCEVIYTSRAAKMDFVDSVGLKVDIWIDDCPARILAND